MKAVRNFAWGLRALDLRSVPSLAAGLFMLALTACSPSPITLRGFAVADVNDEIGLLDLETGARRTLLKEEETKDLDSLVAGPPGKILFTSGFYLEGKVVFEFDVCSGVTKRLIPSYSWHPTPTLEEECPLCGGRRSAWCPRVFHSP